MPFFDRLSQKRSRDPYKRANVLAGGDAFYKYTAPLGLRSVFAAHAFYKYPAPSGAGKWRAGARVLLRVPCPPACALASDQQRPTLARAVQE